MNDLHPRGRAPPALAADSIPLRIVARRAAYGAVLSLLPVALWCLTHRYRGVVGDAELYAVQALSRTDPSLAHDVFLNNASQDRYTIFSPVYAFFIKLLGLQRAPITLLVCCKLCFYAAAWEFTRKLFNVHTALLTTALLIVVPLEYGAFHVFQVAEDMLTARSMAEAFAMTGLCLHVHGRRNAGIALTAVALSIHALMALPMVLLLVCLRSRTRTNLRWALAAIAAALCGACAAAMALQWAPSVLRVMPPSWLEMVRERSQFVFLQLWTLRDWEANARPFVSLALGALVIRDVCVRSLCVSAMIVGATGLAIALIAGLIGPVPILLQGQAWRWTWVTGLASLLMLAPTVLAMWRCERCGPLCAVLLLMGWLISAVEGVYCVVAALCLWYGRDHIPASTARYLRATAALIGVLVLARVIGTGWTALASLQAHAETEGKTLLLVRTFLGLDCVAVVLVFLLSSWAFNSRAIGPAVAVAVALATATVLAAPGALENPLADGTSAQLAEFADWRDVIPPGDNVLVVPRYYSAGFAWFTLQRPSYLTVDQSSGVIFSQATAAEVRRRSDVLLPLQEPDWRLLSRYAKRGGRFDAASSPLTRDVLVRICSDSELNFVVARENVGFDPIPHRRPGIGAGWNLYDCKHVNSSANTVRHDSPMSEAITRQPTR
jgi:hypothetical protein